MSESRDDRAFRATIIIWLRRYKASVQGILHSVLVAWSEVWWIVLPLIAFFIFWDFWLLYLHVRFVKAITWKLLEIKVPKNVLKTPKAMEQIFAAAHAPYSYGLHAIR